MCFGLSRRGSPQNPSPVWYHKSGVGTIIINQIVVLNTHSRVVREACARWQPASCEVRSGGSVPPQVYAFFVAVLDNMSEASPGRMCGGRANLALVAPCCVLLWEKRTCFCREVLLVPLGTIGPEVVCDLTLYVKHHGARKSPAKSGRHVCVPEMGHTKTVGPACGQTRAGRQ